MGKGKLLYKEEVTIEGYKGIFIKECRLSMKDGFFSINYPSRIIAKNIIETDEVFSQTLEDVEKRWRDQVSIFEALGNKYESVIRYKLEERGSFSDGSGDGFIFIWGVFRKVIDKSGEFQYFFERSSNNEPISAGWHERKDWKETSWSQEKEAAFLEISKQVVLIHARIHQIVNEYDFANFKPTNTNLLTGGETTANILNQ